jgi:hypothetical protein
MITAATQLIVSKVAGGDEFPDSPLRQERFQRNWNWFQANIREIGERFRGKSICIAGQEIFAADSPEGAIALARTAHPDDDGLLSHFIPREKRARIYASSR